MEHRIPTLRSDRARAVLACRAAGSNSMNNTLARQIEICTRYGADYIVAPADSKLGIALNVRAGLVPINGVRHMPEEDTCGWFIWAGAELSSDDDFFKPLHVAHVQDWCPTIDITKYLGLAPGWRFLTDGEYEDVWFDPTAIGPNE